MSSGVQLSGNEMLNKKVLSSRRNVRNDETVRRETGMLAPRPQETPGLQLDFVVQDN